MTKEELELFKTCIPAYEPSPCECARQREYKGKYYYATDCDCRNPGDLNDAARWCERMAIADCLDKMLTVILQKEVIDSNKQ